MGSNKNIHIKLHEAPLVFSVLGIEPKTDNLMDVKKAIFKLYGISNPEIMVQSSRKTLSQQRPNHAYGIAITDWEMKRFMAIFSLSENDFFQESIGGRIVSDILGRKREDMMLTKREPDMPNQDDNECQNPDEVVIDQTDDDAPIDIPSDRRRVKTHTIDPPIETLQGWVARGKLITQPDFQRYFVWNNTKASRLIESLLLDIPIPVVYVAEEANKTFSVVDGQQRITSICSYIGGKYPDGHHFPLSGLQVLTELNGKLFNQLASEFQEAILNAVLRLIIIEQDSDSDVKFEVFERLNLGAEKLNDQELRNSIYRGEYNKLLKALSTNPFILKVMGLKQPHKRMADRQLILRFFAMWRNTHLKYKSPMKQFLNREMDNHRNPSANELGEMRSIFEKSIEIAYTVFGQNAFKRFNAWF